MQAFALDPRKASRRGTRPSSLPEGVTRGKEGLHGARPFLPHSRAPAGPGPPLPPGNARQQLTPSRRAGAGRALQPRGDRAPRPAPSPRHRSRGSPRNPRGGGGTARSAGSRRAAPAPTGGMRAAFPPTAAQKVPQEEPAPLSRSRPSAPRLSRSLPRARLSLSPNKAPPPHSASRFPLPPSPSHRRSAPAAPPGAGLGRVGLGALEHGGGRRAQLRARRSSLAA